MEHKHDSPLQIDVRWDGAVATVTVTGNLDITTASALTRRVPPVAAGHPVRLVLDLRGLAPMRAVLSRMHRDPGTYQVRELQP